MNSTTRMTGRPRAAGWVAAASAVVGAVHAGPALTFVPQLRACALPGLAGVGLADHIAITFDDGPDPTSTPQFLSVLDDHRVHATFFVLGRMLVRAPELGREIAAAGHELAVHGWEHCNLLGRGPRATYDDFARARDLVGDVTGTAPRFVRPPYGVLTAAALWSGRRLGLTPVLWTAWGRDWEARATASSVRALVNRDARGGGTVLLHDSDCTSSPQSWRATLGAMPMLLDDWRARRWTVGPLAEHLSAG